MLSFLNAVPIGLATKFQGFTFANEGDKEWNTR